MESLRQKRSKVFIANRSSTEGNRQARKQRNTATFSSDSSSCSSGITDDDLVMFDMRQRSSRQPAGTPIKKLLEKEMSQETESRRQSQSVIARLMGLDVSAPLLPAKRSEKRYSEESAVMVKVEQVDRSSPFSSRPSSRRSSKDDQEYKDVFEVAEASNKVEKIRFRPHQTARSNITSDEMAFIRQKFMEAKQLLTDVKLHDSKEFHDAIEVLDSNRDLLLRFLQQPDSLFRKRLNDLDGATFQSHCNQISTAKSSKAGICEVQYHGLKSGREKMPRKFCRSSSKHKNNYSVHPYFSSAPDSLKPRKLEGGNDCDIVPTRIVVLRPNIRKDCHPTKSPSSPHPHALLSDSSSLEDFPSFRCKVREQIGRKKLNGDMQLKLQSRESRDLSKGITMEMNREDDCNSPSFLPLKMRRCGASDSSSTVSMNQSYTTTLISMKSSDWNNQHKSAPHSAESSVAMEAKRRLSRRWKMTHKSQEIGELSRGSTLADMLSITDKGARCPNSVVYTSQKGFGGNSLTATLVEPLGISSRDGWKDICVNNLSRSRSLPSSSNLSCSPSASTGCEAPRKCRYTLPSETIKREKNKKVISHVDPRDALASPKLMPRQVERDYRHFIRGESSNASEEVYLRRNQAKKDLREIRPRNPDSDASASVNHEDFTSASVNHEDFTVEREEKIYSTETLHLQLSTPLLNSSPFDRDDQAPKESLGGSSKGIPDPVCHSAPELESPESSKDADQPSPISTLEAPFTDDISSGSECFESLSADLHGLRMQLQLLKLESEAHTECTALIYSDEDTGEYTPGLSEDKATRGTEGSWESAYVTDILVHSGYIEYDPETFVSKLHSLESPIDPFMFEELEKEGFCSATSLRTERRLLFDRLNFGMKEIYHQLTDPHPWVRTTGSIPAMGNKLGRDGLLDGLCRSVVCRDRKAIKGAQDRVLVNDTQWLNLRNDFDLVGKEIERLLVDDIVGELVVEFM
ncbi:hypothetical protein SAY87_024154 [Trapa incisa]|uniref:DUF4378 domain-containing protein n=1 Tax=Trapa incisa TaxID=236973 RepID=A0AAN7QUY2_9MYRT|nr:hypothetical protein SAY87_024154 [Trapa incisa]